MEEPNGVEEVKEEVTIAEEKRTEPTEEEKAAFRNPARNEGEPYEQYKIRRAILNKVEKSRSKGFWYWRSKNNEDLRKGKRDTSWGTLSKDVLEAMAKESKQNDVV